MIYPITTPKQVDGANVVPTPSSGLSDLALQLATLHGHIAGLDAGTFQYEFQEVNLAGLESATGPQLVAFVQSIYAERLPTIEAEYQARYRFTGAAVDGE